MFRELLLSVIVFGCFAAHSSVDAQTTNDEIAQLQQRVAELEKTVRELNEFIEPMKAQQAAEARQKSLRARFQRKMDEDLKNYSQKQLGEAERLYQVANQKWGTDESLQSLKTMIKQFPDINRTGCAVLYVAQRSEGEERAKYLQQCIEKHNDCFYGDGVQVGAMARLLLMRDHFDQGQLEKARTLRNELRQDYADAVDHSGKLLSISADSVLIDPVEKNGAQ